MNGDETSMTLGETMRALRKKRGLTQEKPAEGLCLSVTVSRLENGHQSMAAARQSAPVAKNDVIQ